MNLSQQIAAMSPERYARAAKRAAALAKELADKTGRNVSAGIRYLAEASEDEIARRRSAADKDGKRL